MGSNLTPTVFDEKAMMQSPELDFVCDDLLKNFAYHRDKTQGKVYEPITENILVADFRGSMDSISWLRKNDITFLVISTSLR